MAGNVVLSGVGVGVDRVERVGHAFEYLLQADHLAEEALNVSVHGVFLTCGNGIRAMLERCWCLSAKRPS